MMIRIRRLALMISVTAPLATVCPALPAEDETGPKKYAVSDFVPNRKQLEWWAFQPVENVDPPELNGDGDHLSMIDRFVRAKLQQKGQRHSRPADKRTLLRRAKFALVGLPPTPGEIEAFVRDDSPKAFKRVVDRLLASAHFGEHLGRQWLDVVRYTDYLNPQADDVMGPAPKNFDIEFYEAYRYRDWVVDALNRDMPFDDFIVHQIVGDLLPSPAGAEFYANGLIATTMLSIGVWDNGDADKKKIVSDIVDDQINVVGKAFLGMTLACARCHDHKFDPISEEDYYALAGIFYSTRILDSIGPVGLHTNALRTPLATKEYVERWKAETGEIEELKKKLGIDEAKTPSDLKEEERKPLQKKLQRLEKKLQPRPPTAMAAMDGGTPESLFPEIGDVPIHRAGRYDNLGDLVRRQMPSFFCGDEQAAITEGSGRKELANWIAQPGNPLTARVIVNRIWQHLFGHGLVRTSNNFGLLGEPPTHPKLLDWIAVRFVEDGWSIKRLIRRMMSSATYQQVSAVTDPTDPENRWLATFQSRRLRSEEIRDSMLVAAGTLDPSAGGPATQNLLRPRRSLYIQTVRGDRRNYSTLFDAADPEQCVGARRVSTVAPQALFFMNGKFVRSQARNIANRLETEVPDGDEARIEHAYELLYGRSPDEGEIAIGLRLLAEATVRQPEFAWSEYVHVLLCANEFIYVD
jgi:hypothetical protein